ncbi:acyltransferase [Nitrospira sp. NS4]|uniref:acyltransferase n=1 Tax=Nitrospira sp. NS4 TaxID=3414498 RepID=UPI003C2CB66B
MALNPRLQELWQDLRDLHHYLRSETYRKYKRINPFYEDLFDWKERGEFWVHENRSITIYNSASIVGDVEIGERSWIGPFTSLDGTGGLKIGRNCSISVGCQLVSHDSVKWALSGGKQAYEYAPIVIGDCCFLGSHVVIGKGVTIGDHCLIAAGAVVTRNVVSSSIMAGVPARLIGKVHLADDGTVGLEYFRRTLDDE